MAIEASVHRSSSPRTRRRTSSLSRKYGSAFARSLVPADHTDDLTRVCGHISTPQLTRGRSSHQFFTVNGRRVHNVTLSRGLRDGYGPLLMKGRYPVCFLDIRLPPDQVDVNVHPTKREVRFRSESGIARVLREAVRSALGDADIIPRMDDADLSPAGGTAGGTGGRQTKKRQYLCRDCWDWSVPGCTHSAVAVYGS